MIKLDFRPLCSQVHNDWVNHGKDWTLPGFRALAVYRFGVWRLSIEPRLIRAPLSVFYRFLYRRVRNRYGIELPHTVVLQNNFFIDHQGGIVVHGYCEFGDGCRIRQNVTLGIKDVGNLKAVPKLGTNVDIGAGAVILGSVTIGDNARIGANSVVVKNVEPNQTVAGVPAKPLERGHVDVP